MGPPALAARRAARSRSRGLAGVTVEVKRGEVVSCAPQVNSEPSTWAVGAPDTWLDAVIDGEIGDLRIGGARPQLAMDLIAGIHIALFGDWA